MNKPSIVIITPGTFPIPSFKSSSVERVVMNITSLLKHEVQFLIFGKKVKGLPFYEKSNGITYIRSYYRSRMNYLYKINQQLQKESFSIIQVENRPKFARYFKKMFPRRQVWLSLHSTKFITQPHIHIKQLANCLHYTDKIIVNSMFLKEKLLSFLPEVGHKVEVNYLGVDPNQFISRWSEEGQRTRAELLEKLGYTDKKIILYVGRLIEIKGVHHLLDVMPTIVKHYPNTVLLIVGSAYYGKNEVTSYVSKLHQQGNKFPNHVRFIPFVSYNEIQKWFSLADITVVPSSENEAFGLVNVEAMACGVPVVATNVGGMKEIIEHGKTGYLIGHHHIYEELVSCILELLSNPAKCRLMGEASIQHVLDQFTWQHTAKRYNDMYNRYL